MNEVLKQMLAQGLNAVKVSIRKIAWSSPTRGNGETWAYSSRGVQIKCNFFNRKDSNASYSFYDPSAPKNETGGTHTIWLNGVDDKEAKMYVDTYGEEAILIISPDGDSTDLLSVKQAQELLGSPVSTSPSPQPSQQA